MAVKPIPDGYHAVTPYLAVRGADKVIEFVTKAFGAQERFRMDAPDGRVGHAEVQIGDSIVMLGEPDQTDQGEAMPGMIHLYVADVDAAYARAVEAGATPLREPANQFYGDRSGGVKDVAGNHWWISTHVEDVPPEEMETRAKEWQAQQASKA